MALQWIAAGTTALASAGETPPPAPSTQQELDGLVRDALSPCASRSEALDRVAAMVVDRKAHGLPMPELDAIASAQRAAGEPHPWARAWAASGPMLGLRARLASLHAWLERPSDARSRSLRRCGAATGTRSDGSHVLAVVMVEALADLAPFPSRARVGQWMTVTARLNVPASAGTVFVLGPRGGPRTLLTSFDGRTLVGRFAPDRPGTFSVQVVATTLGGPRPVLETSIPVDVDRTDDAVDHAAPGEEASDGEDDDDRLARMLAAARSSEGVPALIRDTRLDRVARSHAISMAVAQELAHDCGDGDPLDRIHGAGLNPSSAAENVAHAPTLRLAHRALWASLSHRVNMLRSDLERVGVGAARDGRGDVWVVEVLAAGLDPEGEPATRATPPR